MADIDPVAMPYRTRLCKFMKKGGCTKGTACHYAHDRDEQNQAKIASSGGKRCKFFKRGMCRFGDACNNLHKLPTERPGAAAADRRIPNRQMTNSDGPTDDDNGATQDPVIAMLPTSKVESHVPTGKAKLDRTSYSAQLQPLTAAMPVDYTLPFMPTGLGENDEDGSGSESTEFAQLICGSGSEAMTVPSWIDIEEEWTEARQAFEGLCFLHHRGAYTYTVQKLRL